MVIADLEKYSRFTDVKGVRTHYCDAGKGEPLVLLHGGGAGGGYSIAWRYNIAELAKDYDADYYVEKQVLPAVLKILGALGYDEKDITLGGKQTGLDSW